MHKNVLLTVANASALAHETDDECNQAKDERNATTAGDAANGDAVLGLFWGGVRGEGNDVVKKRKRTR